MLHSVFFFFLFLYSMLYLYSFLTTKGIAIPQGLDTDHKVAILLYLQPESTVTVLSTHPTIIPLQIQCIQVFLIQV